MRTLQLLPVREVVQIVEQNEVVEVKCEFCGKIRSLDKGAVREHMNERLMRSVNAGTSETGAAFGESVRGGEESGAADAAASSPNTKEEEEAAAPGDFYPADDSESLEEFARRIANEGVAVE